MSKKETERNVIVYRGNSISAMDVMVDCETVWLTLGQMSHLFGRDMSVIGKHVKNVFAEGELPEEGFRQILPKRRPRAVPLEGSQDDRVQCGMRFETRNDLVTI